MGANTRPQGATTKRPLGRLHLLLRWLRLLLRLRRLLRLLIKDGRTAGWAGVWASGHRCARLHRHLGHGAGPALSRGSPGAAHLARLAAGSDPGFRQCPGQRRDRAAAVPAGDPLLGEPEHQLSRDPQEPARHLHVRHRPGDRHRVRDVVDGAGDGHGIARGSGPRRRALPHRRRRRGRSGEKAAPPGPDRAARREHHQRRDRAGPVRRDRPRRHRRGRGQPVRPGHPVHLAPTSAVSPPGCWSGVRWPWCAAESTRPWRKAR